MEGPAITGADNKKGPRFQGPPSKSAPQASERPFTPKEDARLQVNMFLSGTLETALRRSRRRRRKSSRRPPHEER